MLYVKDHQISKFMSLNYLGADKLSGQSTLYFKIECEVLMLPEKEYFCSGIRGFFSDDKQKTITDQGTDGFVRLQPPGR